jgi:hypothetical protein
LSSLLSDLRYASIDRFEHRRVERDNLSIVCNVLQNAPSQTFARHDSVNALLARVAAAFIIEEEEGAVTNEPAAERAAEDVEQQT